MLQCQKVVNEGRRVINNIQKSSALYLTKNLFAILLTIMYIIIGFKTNGGYRWPFEATHFYLIEWFILGFATTCLSLQPNNDIIKGKFLSNVIRGILPANCYNIVIQFNIVFLERYPWF